MPVRTEIITIGDEILIGQTIDTNSAWLGHELDARGFEVIQISSISDQPAAIVRALNLALERSMLVIITGGLGPTGDDRTKQTLADYFGMELLEDPKVLEHIINLLGGRGIPLNMLNSDQAKVPVGCHIFKNRAGTAPGMLFRKGEAVIVALPGVPYEMKSIASLELFPWLAENCQTERRIFKMIMTTGYPESVLATKIGHWENALPANYSLAYLPSPGIVKLRLSVSNQSEDEMINGLEKQISELTKIIPDAIYSLEHESIEETVGRKLRSTGSTMGTAESCTGGRIGSMVTSVPGSSAYYKGSVVAYSNDLKIKLLGVQESEIFRYGAVSEEVVRVMADHARQVLHADYTIATSGIAGPDGGTKEKPVGQVWIAVASANGVVSESFQFGNHRGRNITRSSVAGLNMLLKVHQKEFQKTNGF